MMDQTPRHKLMYRWIALIAGSLLLAAAVLLIAIWAKEWNRPELTDVRVYEGVLKQGSTPAVVKISCKCPVAFLVSKTQDVLFSITLNSAPTGPAKGTPPNGGVTPQSLDFIWVWVEASNGEVKVPGSTTPLQNTAYIGPMRDLPSGISQQVRVRMRPDQDGPFPINFHFDTAPENKEYDGTIGTVAWTADSRPPFFVAALPFMYSGLVLLASFLVLWRVQTHFGNIATRTAAQISAAAARAEGTEGSHYAWEIARIKLEAYFDRNLVQVNLVFWVAVLVVSVGFGFVLSGIVLCFRDPSHIGSPLVAAISGLITQFIGATFMVIYRSTMKQANDFMAVLERINVVNMAVQVLDRSPETSAELKNEVRARMVGLLLARGAIQEADAPAKSETTGSLGGKEQ